MRKNLIYIYNTLIILIFGITLGACVNIDAPANLEPCIVLCEATDITRTTSVISATVDNRGSYGLDYIRFYYGEQGHIDRKSDDLKVSASEIKFELRNLKPGTTYYYYAEGGTSTAVLRSETMSFTTIPNDKPTVTKAVPLSTGPTGIIIEFEIEDDGGEDILEGGCEISDILSHTVRRLYLSSNELKEGKNILYINGLTPDIDYGITTFATNSSGESKAETLEYTTHPGIVLHEAGVLSLLLGNNISLNSLTISGPLNGTDIRFLRELTGAPILSHESGVSGNVTDLDLTDAEIVEGGESYDGSRFTEHNIFTTGIFADCKNLKNILLPNGITEIKRDAFAHCNSLETLNIPIKVNQCTPSIDCPTLKYINVIAANLFFASVDGVLFNKDITEIIWFPLGKTGHYSLPSSIIAIGENAFMGTHIISLEIPSSVTTISRGAFYGSALQEITLPNNLTNVSEAMFQNCNDLSILRLGTGIEFIGNYAFDGTSLRDIYISAKLPPYVSADAFVNNIFPMFENCTLHVPSGCKAVYRNHSKWKQFKNIVEF